MAKVISIVGTLSGKLAGTVYSHNRWGNYIRQLVIPTNPNTPAQSSQRGRIANAASDWSLLTDEQRLAWDHTPHSSRGPTDSVSRSTTT